MTNPPTEPFGLTLAREHLSTTYEHHIIVGIDTSGEEPVIRVHPNITNKSLFKTMTGKIIETLKNL